MGSDICGDAKMEAKGDEEALANHDDVADGGREGMLVDVSDVGVSGSSSCLSSLRSAFAKRPLLSRGCVM